MRPKWDGTPRRTLLKICLCQLFSETETLLPLFPWKVNVLINILTIAWIRVHVIQYLRVATCNSVACSLNDVTRFLRPSFIKRDSFPFTLPTSRIHTMRSYFWVNSWRLNEICISDSFASDRRMATLFRSVNATPSSRSIFTVLQIELSDFQF